MGLTFTIGFASLIAVSFIPPFSTTKRVKHHLKVATSSLGLMIKKITAEFESDNFTKFLVQKTEARVLLKIAEKRIEEAEHYMTHLTYERPFSSFEGIRKYISFLRNLIIHCKGNKFFLFVQFLIYFYYFFLGNLMALKAFHEDTPVCSIRYGIGNFIFTLFIFYYQCKVLSLLVVLLSATKV